MRNRFDEQLMQLNRELIEMGALCEEAISVASESLLANDKQLAAKVAPLDSEIDRKERTIESLCLKLLLQQQPVARDDYRYGAYRRSGGGYSRNHMLN